MKRNKVIGVGFHKTGTTSLMRALQQLGYEVTGPNGTENPRIAEEIIDMAYRLLQQYDAVVDHPWPVLYKEVDDWYPSSKFILTIRPTEDWIRSVVNYFGYQSSPMREWIYGVGRPKGNEEVYIARYKRHNREVLDYFKDRPEDLLVFNLSGGDGWKELCSFLDVPIVPGPFPHSNPAPESRVKRVIARIQRNIKRKTPGNSLEDF